MRQDNQDLTNRYLELEKKFKQLSDGEDYTDVTIKYSWSWECEDYGYVWVSLLYDDKEEFCKLSDLQDRLSDNLNKKIKDFISEVDQFQNDGGNWDYW